MEILKAVLKISLFEMNTLLISFLFDQQWLHNAVLLKSIKHRFVVTFPNSISMSPCDGIMVEINRLNNLHISYVLGKGVILVFTFPK